MIKCNHRVICCPETRSASSHGGAGSEMSPYSWKSDLAPAAPASSRGSPKGVPNDLQAGAWALSQRLVTLPTLKVDSAFVNNKKHLLISLLQWRLCIRASYSGLGNHHGSITSLLRSEVVPICLMAKSHRLEWEQHMFVQRQSLALSNSGLKGLFNILCKKE